MTSLPNIGAGEYETVAASQTAQTLGPTGATGDYISGILVTPATTSPAPLRCSTARHRSRCLPAGLPVSPIWCRSYFRWDDQCFGAWKITTGASVSCIGIGNFT